MKLRVNLYTKALRPKLDLFNLSFVATLLLLIVLTLAGASYYTYQQNAAKQRQVEAKQAELAQIEATLATKMMQLANRKADPALVQQVDDLAKVVEAKEVLVSKLGVLAQINSGDYAGLMHDLAAYRQQQIWLTQIQVNDRNIFIQGGALDSQAVPQWLENLSASRFFKGQHFQQARLFRGDEDGLLFEVGSDINQSGQAQGGTQ